MTTIDLGVVEEPVSVADAKLWARIERDDEDGLIAALIRAAREAIETATGLALSQRSFRLVLDPVPPHGWIEATRHPLEALGPVTAFAADGTPNLLDAEDVVIERSMGLEAFRLSPAAREAAANGIEIEFTAGFSAGKVPENLLLALKTIVAASYETRAAVGPDMQPALMPDLAATLIAPYRRVRI
ncbi:head-tail connector protein [Aurantimonas sp. VKM B-3413]|uniref:head-tail connector protein n=1 Tax=Aurantimonas sp. VKM B-3413 TaxID=2779401 RepID=UPI001E62DD8F|nr:head-tail connector protein [Aurantimonas sp. VKM B-3413]MCB8836101.1 head-tail connector protein [Aurantimonas sp. VKM B-3413]